MSEYKDLTDIWDDLRISGISYIKRNELEKESVFHFKRYQERYNKIYGLTNGNNKTNFSKDARNIIMDYEASLFELKARIIMYKDTIKYLQNSVDHYQEEIINNFNKQD